MQIHRLLEIVNILFDKKMVTAKELSEQFEVSQRTIYRDVDVLSAAGIPIYTNKGKGGGIGLLDSFVLDKSMLSEKEQIDILSSLQGLKALDVTDVDPVLKKLSVIFNKNHTSWIEVDFSHWGSGYEQRDIFNNLKTAILNKCLITFDYYNSNGEKRERSIEPVRLIFKGQAWYVYGFCHTKDDFRLFKITRIKNLMITKETFTRNIPEQIADALQDTNLQMGEVVLRIEARMAYRVYDEFDPAWISKNADGSFTVTLNIPEDEWVCGYILSFGDSAEVLAPVHLRTLIKRKLEENLRKYL